MNGAEHFDKGEQLLAQAINQREAKWAAACAQMATAHFTAAMAAGMVELESDAPGRRRMTDEHLIDVANVYRAAWQEGGNPTQAVANRFGTSHSTAARWVGLARKAEYLPSTDPGRPAS